MIFEKAPERVLFCVKIQFFPLLLNNIILYIDIAPDIY